MKVTIQMPSSTSFNPNLWPAMTVELLIFLPVHADAAAGCDESVVVVVSVAVIGR